MAPTDDLDWPPRTRTLALSHDNNESNMQAFIRHHITSIIQPVTEHVRELFSQIESMSKDLILTNGKIENGRATLDQHGLEFSTLQALFEQMTARLDRTQDELSMAKKERNTMESDHEVVKASLKKIEERLNQLPLSIDVIRQNIRDNESLAHKVQFGLSKTDKIVLEHGDILDHIKKLHEELDGRHMETRKELANFERSSAATEQRLKNLKANFEQQKENEMNHFKIFTDRIHTVEGTISNMQKLLQTQESALKAADVDIQELKSGLSDEDGQTGKIDHLYSQHIDVIKTLKGHTENLDRLSGDIAETKRDFTLERHNVSDFMREYDGRVCTNTASIDALRKNQQRHIGQIQKADRSIEQLQDDQRKLKDWADMTEQDVKSCTTWQRAANGQLDIHALEIRNLQSGLHDHGNDIDLTINNLRVAKHELETTNSNLAKLSVHCDAHNKTFEGLSKGLKDSFRHVVGGESGMVPPKTGTSLPSMQRPASAHQRPPSSQIARAPKTAFP